MRGFVARADDLDIVLAGHPDLLGEAVTATRGTLSWRFGLRPDGAWPAGGAVPCVMDWGRPGNPAAAMPELGARLVEVLLEHPEPDAVAALYRTLGLLNPPRIVAGPALRFSARIATPSGLRTLF